MATTRAGIYCRISRDKTGERAGVNRQAPECRALCKKLGWTVVEVYEDNDISAYSGRRRPEFERMKGDLRDGRIDAIVAWHPDRLYRRVQDLLGLIDLINEKGSRVATVQAGDVDLSNANGRLVAKIGASVAEHESEHKAERVRLWHKERAEAGLPSGGPRAYGYEKDKMTVKEDEAAHLREAAERRVSGETWWSIITDWNERGIQTVSGKPWSTVSLSGVLIAPRIVGLREHNGTLRKAAWEPIIDREMEFPRFSGHLR